MSDYFDRVERELRVATAARVAAPPRRLWLRLSVGNALTVAGAVAAIVIGSLALTLHHQRNQPAGASTTPGPDLSVAMDIGPTLRDLLENFAVLRGPVPADNQALIRKYTVSTTHRTEVPELVRSAGAVSGVHVYFVVYPIFKHGSYGPVVAHELIVMGDGGNPYDAGDNYMIFPTSVTGMGTNRGYLGVVPDDVRSVDWRVGCHTYIRNRCVRPSKHTIHLIPHHNVIFMHLPSGRGWRAWTPPITRVTWYRADGSHSVFNYRHANAAVPFAGAPPWTGRGRG